MLTLPLFTCSGKVGRDRWPHLGTQEPFEAVQRVGLGQRLVVPDAQHARKAHRGNFEVARAGFIPAI